ncbi:MAG TPA: DUF2142 domain-containing protein [Acidimicrobiales bacterium]|nr:DUF2142 domain-containing protein [Acidimicrobiales bacterium]
MTLTVRAYGILVFLLLFVLIGAWAIATPPYAGPDEPAHVIRADSLIHGELLGTSIPGQPDAVVAVHAAEIYTSNAERLGCWPFYPDNTPECTGEFVGSGRRVATKTHVGRYNPLYYAIVGIPARFSASSTTVYLMRLTGAALSAGLVALAATALLSRPRASVSLLGLAFAFTPMAAFLGGVVNVSGMEISGAIALWAGGLVAADPSTPPNGRGRAIVAATAGGCALVASRGLSVVFLAAIVGLVLAAVTVRPRTAMLRDPRVRLGVRIVAAVTLASVAWILWADSLAFVPLNRVEGTASALRLTAGGTDAFTWGMIGLFQWLDTPAPVVTYYTWVVGVGALAALGLALAPRRLRWVLGLAIAATFVVPFLQVPTSASTGLIWGGRYSLPLAAGVPVLAAYGLSMGSPAIIDVVRRLGRLLVVGWGVGFAAAFYWTGHRNAVGASGPVLYLGRERWNPPVPYSVLTLLVVVSIGGLVIMFLRLLARERGEHDRRPAVEVNVTRPMVPAEARR